MFLAAYVAQRNQWFFVTVCYLKALCYAVQWSLEQGGLEVD